MISREDGTNGNQVFSKGYGIDTPPLTYQQVLYILYNNAEEKQFKLIKTHTDDCTLVYKAYPSGLLFLLCTSLQNCPQNLEFFLNLMDAFHSCLPLMFDVATVVNESRSSPSAVHILKQELNKCSFLIDVILASISNPCFLLKGPVICLFRDINYINCENENLYICLYHNGYEYKWNKKWEEFKPIYRMYFMLLSHKLTNSNLNIKTNLNLQKKRICLNGNYISDSSSVVFINYDDIEIDTNAIFKSLINKSQLSILPKSDIPPFILGLSLVYNTTRILYFYTSSNVYHNILVYSSYNDIKFKLNYKIIKYSSYISLSYSTDILYGTIIVPILLESNLDVAKTYLKSIIELYNKK